MRGPWEYESPACAGVGTELFYLPDKDDDKAVDRKQLYLPDLKKVCGGCPHLRECGDWALRYEDHGYWAGMTSHDREAERKARRITYHNISAARENQTKVARSA